MDASRITVYRRDGVLYFQPRCGSLGIGPIRRINEPVPPNRVGEAALATFGDCKPKGAVPWPTDWRTYLAPILEMLGVTSEKELIAKASSISLDLDGDRLIAHPTLNMGAHEGGFGPLPPEKDVVIPSGSSPEEIGIAIERALAACEVYTGGQPWWYEPLIEN